MSSTNKTSLGLNMWEASDKPVRQDFVNDNVIIDDEVTKLKQDIGSNNTVINEKINKLNSNLTTISNKLNPQSLSIVRPAYSTDEVPSGLIEYIIKNGVCYVRMSGIRFGVAGTERTLSVVMPKPALGIAVSILSAITGSVLACVYLNYGTTILLANVVSNTVGDGYLTFSYPVIP